MPPFPTVAIHPPLPEGTERQLVRAYQERTKHRFAAFAPGPETLDWDAQPAPFRRFDGAECVRLALLEELPPSDPCALAMARPFAYPIAPPPQALRWTLDALGVVLQCSLGVTAHKSLGPDRWALRANPSSGNLHPVEAYLVSRGVAFLNDGVYHYAPDTHALERMARWPGVTADSDAGGGLFIALSCVQWRETWKYGERAFRYCQLDVGHALAALALAVGCLGGHLSAEPQIDSAWLSRLLHLRQAPGAPESEREEAETLLRIDHPSLPRPRGDTQQLLDERTLRRQAVEPSVIDPRPLYRWPLIEQVAQATRTAQGRSRTTPPEGHLHRAKSATSVPPLDNAPSLAAVVLGRRSAQRFDIRYAMPEARFLRLLWVMRESRTPPHAVTSSAAALDVALFVYRVDGLEPGLYFLPCAARGTERLRRHLRARFDVVELGDAHAPLGLQRLSCVPEKELMRRARLLHCQQDIAASSCFSLAMLAPLGPAIERDPSDYRRLHREAGMLGHTLYLQAEAEGLRGTGIGCFLDDEVHDLLRLSDAAFQTLYHFTIGRPLQDPRIESGPAYPDRTPFSTRSR